MIQVNPAGSIIHPAATLKYSLQAKLIVEPVSTEEPLGIELSALADRLIVKSAALIMYVRHLPATYRFWRYVRRLPQLCPPQWHNDKFHWRKVFDHNPDFEIFCDKLACKQWVRERCPDLLIPATLWQGTSARDIPDELLTRPGFIKANNGSGYNIRLDGQAVDRQSIENRFARWLSRPYGQAKAEWGYKNVPRTVFVEEIITSADGTAPVMVEVYATGGEPAVLYFVTGWKDGNRCGSFFDLSGTRIPMEPDDHGPLPDDWQPPSGFIKALEHSRVLVRDLDHVRCDFLCVGDKVWFSEMTPYNFSGLGSFATRDEEKIVYGGWDLAQSWFLRTEQTGWKRYYAQALRRIMSAQRANP